MEKEGGENVPDRASCAKAERQKETRMSFEEVSMSLSVWPMRSGGQCRVGKGRKEAGEGSRRCLDAF